MRRFGFMAGQTKVPADFNTMGAAEIEALFRGQGVKLQLDTHLLIWGAERIEHTFYPG